jgi:hypothetical protein
MTPEERQTAKERIAKELMAGNPVCHSPKEMFQAVLNKDLRPPISGNVQIPGALTGAAAVQARAAAEAFFTKTVGESPGKELARNLTGAIPTFRKDLPRSTDLTVGGRRVANEASTKPSRAGQLEEDAAVVENGYNEIARLLTGQEGVRFADLSEIQKRQVLLLSGLCCQEMENPAALISMRGFFNSLTYPSLCQAHSRPIHLEKNDEGNFVVRYDASFSINEILHGDDSTHLDPAHSRQDIHVELVIPPDELDRLAKLDWTGIPTMGELPESHRMRFMDSHLSSSITLIESGGENAG